ncbi:hypothetical protein [Mycolicibacterium sp. CBMA 226]|uniref:hypothetical protein n=1 Tax=Mycolicibacterium sp. CBMA 226 TaxID=2606611 RepID=UPI0028BDCE56|nr:hypothetical protein [Mycolicibacterium sp. CBMA 226]
MKGMWRTGLTLPGTFFAVEVVLVILDVPDSLVRGVGRTTSTWCGEASPGICSRDTASSARCRRAASASAAAG